MNKKDLWQVWERPLKQNGLSLKETLILENMAYLKWSREKVLSLWGKSGTEKIKESWLKIHPRTKKDIQNFYNHLELYIPELSSWHAMEQNEDFIEVAKFLQDCLKQNFVSYLDYGSGIGSCGLVFAYFGFSVTLADISESMLNYAQWRLKRHKVTTKFLDLKREFLPKERYDCVTAIEVLEHLTNPVETVNKIRLAMKIGGLLFITTPFFKDPDRPVHLIHEMKVVKEFEKLGMRTETVSKNKIYRVLKKIR